MNELSDFMELERPVEKSDFVISPLDHLNYRLSSCQHKAELRIHCKNDNCGNVDTKPTVLHCFIRYDRCCYHSRRKRALDRLYSYGIKSSRLFHVVIGFPTKPEFHKENKHQEEKVMAYFHRELRKRGYEVKGIRIFDFQDQDEEYSHYHYALLPMKEFDVHQIHPIREKIIKKTGVNFVLRVIGYRPKKSLFDYFSKRIAGKYGHGEKGFFLSDKITHEQYIQNFFRLRSVVTISRRLSCNVAPFSLEWECPHCGCSDFWVEIVDLTAQPEENQTVLDPGGGST